MIRLVIGLLLVIAATLLVQWLLNRKTESDTDYFATTDPVQILENFYQELLDDLPRFPKEAPNYFWETAREWEPGYSGPVVWIKLHELPSEREVAALAIETSPYMNHFINRPKMLTEALMARRLDALKWADNLVTGIRSRTTLDERKDISS